ncbi:MAG TPA: tetratricopeptide repeat protein [Polyangiaceae bacterium]|nr:tetratricopeptide repeat protein [Polyangiaceae bacterium]
MAETETLQQRPAEETAPFVGREDKLERLRVAYQATVDSGAAHALTVIGPPGAGKTRLVREFVAGFPPVEGGGPRVYLARARRQGLSYGVFARLLRARFGIGEEMPLVAAQEKISGEVARVLGHTKVDDVAFFLGQLMDVSFPESPLTLAASDDPGQAQALRRAIVRRFLEADAAQGPVVLVFDDLHLADADSLDLLASLIRHLSGPILILCTAGRELLGQRADWEARLHGRHELLELEPLPADAAAEMIRRMLRRCDGGAPDALVDAGVRAAGGNPGQLAQMVRSYLDAGVLEEDRSGHWRVNLERLSTVRLPMTVEDAVALRISALASAERRVLEHAAAMGSVFWLGGLVALGRMDREPPELWSRPDTTDIARLHKILERLVERDYLLRLEDAVFPEEQEYAFKHNFEREKLSALTSAAASRRYHQTIADWLAQKTTARSREEYVAMLAGHLERSGSLTRSAFTYLDAADLARKNYALRKASEYYAKGLELLGDDDARRRIDALHNHGDVMVLLGKTDEAMEAFRQMLGIAYLMNLLGKGGAAHNRIGRLYRETGFLAESSRHLQAALSLFTAAGDVRGVAASLDDIGKLLWVRGDYDDALKELRRALDMRKELGDRRSIALSLNNIGLVWMDHGRPTNAKEALEAALQIRREINDPVGVAESLSTLGALSVDQNQFESALEYFREAHAVSVEIGERTRIAECLTNIGETQQRLGRGEEAVNTLEKAVALCEELGDKLQLAEAKRGLAKSYLLRGDLKSARRHIRSAVELFGQVRSKAHLAIALRTLGEVTGAGAWGAQYEGKAVEYFMRSIAIAKEIGNEIEVARSYLAFSNYVTASGGYVHNQDIQREAQKLRTMADEIFERQRIARASA